MRPALATLLLLAGCATSGAPPSGQPGPLAEPARSSAPAGPDQVWQGTIRCEPIPGIVSLRLVQPFELRVSGGVARYERIIRRGDTGGDSENRERGEGAVAADGTVTLNGAAQATGYSYTATYSGRLPQSGRRTRLVGSQSWRPARANPAERACSITLSR